MAERHVPRHLSAGVILVDADGRVLLQHRDDDPEIMFPGHWGIVGGAGQAGEVPEDIARREVEEETGLKLGRIEPFRAYYFPQGGPTTNGDRATARKRVDYELYLFHAPCETPAEAMACGEGQALRFFAPHDLPLLDIAYNHRDVLTEFFASPLYPPYLRGVPFGADGGGEPLEAFRAAIASGEPWFEALMQAVAQWEQPAETVDGREYRYLIGDEAFDWLLLAERLLDEAAGAAPAPGAEQLLFHGRSPVEMDEDRLRALIGPSKHRARLNFLYGVIVEEALQYAVELEVSKERGAATIADRTGEDAPAVDPVFQRIYGEPQAALVAAFRAERRLPAVASMSLAELREFTYWLFKYRVRNSEPARVASDTRKALAQLSAIEDAARRRRAAAEAVTAST